MVPQVFKPEKLKFFIYDLMLYNQVDQVVKAPLKHIKNWQTKSVTLLDFSNFKNGCSKKT